jgi:hypothetical protein
MHRRISIRVAGVELTGVLYQTKTAQKIWEALPIKGKAKLWGREIYFEIPVKMPPEDPVPEVPSGTIAYWPDGNCLCLFFGQTPYSPVNVVGKIDRDEDRLASVKEGEEVLISVLTQPEGPR